MGAHESMEHAEHAEHASGSNKNIALLIAVIALFLAFSETLGKGAQTDSISKNVEASNLWAFFQAKSIRRTVVEATSDQARLSLGVMGDDAAKAALEKQIEDWKKTAARYRSEPETGEGSEQLAARAKQAETGPRSLDGEIPSLRSGVGGVSDRHRAGVGHHHHRHDRAGLGRGPAGGHRTGVHGHRPVRAACGASDVAGARCFYRASCARLRKRWIIRSIRDDRPSPSPRRISLIRSLIGLTSSAALARNASTHS